MSKDKTTKTLKEILDEFTTNQEKLKSAKQKWKKKIAELVTVAEETIKPAFEKVPDIRVDQSDDSILVWFRSQTYRSHYETGNKGPLQVATGAQCLFVLRANGCIYALRCPFHLTSSDPDFESFKNLSQVDKIESSDFQNAILEFIDWSLNGDGRGCFKSS